MSAIRLVVQKVITTKWLRDPLTRGRIAARMLAEEARKEMLTWSGWTLGLVTYKAEVMVPAGVIPKNRPHPLEGTTVTEDGLDELMARLDATGHVWVIVASAEVLRG
jgi:hypothetical protein